MARNILNTRMLASAKSSEDQVQILDASEWYHHLRSHMTQCDIQGSEAVLWHVMSDVVVGTFDERPGMVKDCQRLFERQLIGEQEDLAVLAQRAVSYFRRNLFPQVELTGQTLVADLDDKSQRLMFYPKPAPLLMPPSLEGFSNFLKGLEQEGECVPREVWRLLRDYTSQTHACEPAACAD